MAKSKMPPESGAASPAPNDGASGADAAAGESWQAQADRLGQVMDRMSQMMDTLSDRLKAISDTAQGTTQNTKDGGPPDDEASAAADSMSERGEAESERLQSAMDRLSSFEESLSDPAMGQLQAEADQLLELMRREAELYDSLSQTLRGAHDTVTESTPNMKDGGAPEEDRPDEVIELRGPVEDQIVLMFMLLAEESRSDLRDLLTEMDEARRARDTGRDGEPLAPPVAVPVQVPVQPLAGATTLATGASSAAGAASLLPWAALVVVGGIAGGVLGASGALGRPTTDAPAVEAAVAQTTPGYDCPGGAVVASFIPNQRVLARERSDDSEWLAVRDPLNGLRTVWVPAGVVDVDDGQAGIDSLAVGGCPETIIALTAPDADPPAAEPVPGTPAEPGAPGQPAPPAAPAPPPPPPPPSDTTPPSIGSASFSPNPIYQQQTSVLTVSASDNTGVTGVSVTWTGAQSGSAQMTASGSQWRYTFAPSATPFGTITFRVQARDAAGNTSAPVQVNLNYIQFI